MKLFDLCEEWFQSEGYSTIRLPLDLLLVKYQDLKVILHDPGADESYFKMDVRFDASQFEGTQIQLLKAANKLNKTFKIAKAYIEEDGSVIFTTEILFDKTPQVGDILPRLLNILTTLIPVFHITLNEQ